MQFASLLSYECFVQWFKTLVMFHWEDTYHRFLIHISLVQLIHLQMSMSDGCSMRLIPWDDNCFHPWFIHHMHCEIKTNQGKNCETQSSHSYMQGQVIVSFTPHNGSAVPNSMPGAHGFEQGPICSAHSDRSVKLAAWSFHYCCHWRYTDTFLNEWIEIFSHCSRSPFSHFFNRQVEFSWRWRADKQI